MKFFIQSSGILDIVIHLSVLLKQKQKNAADVDGNGKVDTKDARQILLYYVGKITHF